MSIAPHLRVFKRGRILLLSGATGVYACSTYFVLHVSHFHPLTKIRVQIVCSTDDLDPTHMDMGIRIWQGTLGAHRLVRKLCHSRAVPIGKTSRPVLSSVARLAPPRKALPGWCATAFGEQTPAYGASIPETLSECSKPVGMMQPLRSVQERCEQIKVSMQHSSRRTRT